MIRYVNYSARELAILFDYTQSINFQKINGRVMIPIVNGGVEIIYYFSNVNKITESGTTNKFVKNYYLMKYTFYLIVKNRYHRKEVFAVDQIYFSIQTFRK